MGCPTHRLVKNVCFWGSRRAEPWKRPVLFLLSAPFLIGAGALWWALQERGVAELWPILILAVLGVFGLGVALLGCDDCVTRALGEV
jgi:hypothetical protein